MDLSLDQKEFYRSLREMNAEYIVLSSSSAAVSYVETAGCIPVREVEGHIIFRVEEKSKKEDLFLNKAKDYIQLHLNILLFSLTSVFSKAASVQLNRGGIKKSIICIFISDGCKLWHLRYNCSCTSHGSSGRSLSSGLIAS